MKKIALLYCFLLVVWNSLEAQVDSSGVNLTISGYAEPYYGYDFSQPADGNRPGFVYAYNRHNEFNLHLGYIKAAVNAARMRGNLALMAGTYTNANLSAEPGTLKNVLEANAGVKLAKNRELWLDAGIFSSHIGFESAIGKDCWTLTRSISADNSPYYEAGAKLTYITPNDQWLLSALALNGWQRIQRVSGNSLLSGGTQIQYKPNAKVTLNSSTFFGTDKPDTARLWRTFHNFYGIFQLSDQFGLTVGFDTGWEENAREGADANFWYSSVLMARYAINDRLALAGRVEYYSDKNGVIIATDTPNGFQTVGISANLDVQIHQNAVWRIEGKLYNSQDEIFVKDNGTTSANAVVTTAFAVWF
ncbi:MAG: porin [Saprospiraceae bacterium]|nr:porin [Saprospiraceae bacterium]